jgi:hypothetical protein
VVAIYIPDSKKGLKPVSIVLLDAATITPLSSKVREILVVELPSVVEVTLFATCMRAGTTRVKLTIVSYLLLLNYQYDLMLSLSAIVF